MHFTTKYPKSIESKQQPIVVNVLLWGCESLAQQHRYTFLFVVVNALLWDCKSWALKEKDYQCLESCHHTCIRQIPNKNKQSLMTKYKNGQHAEYHPNLEKLSLADSPINQ
jgi:hypothetical protein